MEAPVYGTIVVPVDGSALAERALPVAAALARRDHAQVHLVLVHERPLIVEQLDQESRERLRDHESSYVERLADELRTRHGVRASAVLLDGDVGQAICTAVRERKADLVTMTTHGRTGISRLWIGSVADAVMRAATTPVLMLRASLEPESWPPADGSVFHRILLPLDGSPLAAEIIEHALRLGGSSGCRYVLARVVEPVLRMETVIPDAAGMVLVADEDATEEVRRAARAELEAAAEVIRRDHPGIDVRVAVRVDRHAAEGLLRLAHDHAVDAVAIATHGRGVSRLVLGSVADKVLRASAGAVLVYRPAHD